VPTSTSTTSLPSPTSTSTTTTTGGGGIEAGRALYDSDCSFCHSAGSHDPEGESASNLAGDGDKLVADLGTLDESMDGMMLSAQEMADLAAFLDSL
jgi:mono/diheme cytochrome c family protein